MEVRVGALMAAGDVVWVVEGSLAEVAVGLGWELVVVGS